MYIQHTHPAAETPEARTEALSTIYRACVRKLYNSQLRRALPQRSTPAPNAR